MEILQEKLERDAIAAFRERFTTSPQFIATAPGRVNLLGEHTDYNDGFVLPAAINRSTIVAAGTRDDAKLQLYSENLQSGVLVSLDDLVPEPQGAWSNYITGVAFNIRRRGHALRGANLCILGNIQRGGGLSSSAALELAAAYAFIGLNNLEIPALDVIKLCQQAEHEFAGVHCGIMDQFISCLGKKDQALFIDCRSLEFRHVPFPAGVRILVMYTGVRRALAASEYNKRRDECAAAVAVLSLVLPSVRMLRDVSPQEFAEHQNRLDPLLRKRSRHVITENARVLQSVEALKNGRISEFGKLMYDSHVSLQRDYEVSCAELDALVDICAEADGVYGARMTGAGFGGSAICLVEENHVAEVDARIQAEYPARTGKTPTTIVCTIEHGAAVRKAEQ